MNNSFDWSEYIRSDYVRRKLGETFSEVLARYLDDISAATGIRQKDISVISGIESSMITKYKNGVRKPSLYTLVVICISMRLTSERSKYLLYLMGYILNDCEEHRIYKLFLEGCAFNENYSVENFKLMFFEHGYAVE